MKGKFDVTTGGKAFFLGVAAALTLAACGGSSGSSGSSSSSSNYSGAVATFAYDSGNTVTCAEISSTGGTGTTATATTTANGAYTCSVSWTGPTRITISNGTIGGVAQAGTLKAVGADAASSGANGYMNKYSIIAEAYLTKYIENGQSLAAAVTAGKSSASTDLFGFDPGSSYDMSAVDFSTADFTTSTSTGGILDTLKVQMFMLDAAMETLMAEGTMTSGNTTYTSAIDYLTSLTSSISDNGAIAGDALTNLGTVQAKISTIDVTATTISGGYGTNVTAAKMAAAATTDWAADASSSGKSFAEMKTVLKTAVTTAGVTLPISLSADNASITGVGGQVLLNITQPTASSSTSGQATLKITASSSSAADSMTAQFEDWTGPANDDVGGPGYQAAVTVTSGTAGTVTMSGGITPVGVLFTYNSGVPNTSNTLTVLATGADSSTATLVLNYYNAGLNSGPTSTSGTVTTGLATAKTINLSSYVYDVDVALSSGAEYGKSLKYYISYGLSHTGGTISNPNGYTFTGGSTGLLALTGVGDFKSIGGNDALSAVSATSGFTFGGGTEILGLTVTSGLSDTGTISLTDSTTGSITYTPSTGWSGTFAFGFAVIDTRGHGSINDVQVGVGSLY